MACPVEPLEEIELRCDAGRLLAVVLRRGEQPSFVKPDNLIELTCDWCRRNRYARPWPRRVLHRFNVLGELIETLLVE